MFVYSNFQLFLKQADAVADLTTQLPHMLPTKEEFEKIVTNEFRLKNEDHVILYDRSTNFVASARVFWTFRVFGHQKISILGLKEIN